MFFYEFDEILRRVTRERGFTKMRILRDKILGLGVNICKITSPAARDDYLTAKLGVMLDDEHPLPASPGGKSAKQPRRPAANDNGVVDHFLIAFRICSSRSRFAEMSSYSMT